MALTVTMRCDVCGETRECDDASPATAAELRAFAAAHSCEQHGRKRVSYDFAPEQHPAAARLVGSA